MLLGEGQTPALIPPPGRKTDRVKLGDFSIPMYIHEVYMVTQVILDIHLIRAGNIVYLGPNRVYVKEQLCRPVGTLLFNDPTYLVS